MRACLVKEGRWRQGESREGQKEGRLDCSIEGIFPNPSFGEGCLNSSLEYFPIMFDQLIICVLWCYWELPRYKCNSLISTAEMICVVCPCLSSSCYWWLFWAFYFKVLNTLWMCDVLLINKFPSEVTVQLCTPVRDLLLHSHIRSTLPSHFNFANLGENTLFLLVSPTVREAEYLVRCLMVSQISSC